MKCKYRLFCPANRVLKNPDDCDLPEFRATCWNYDRYETNPKAYKYVSKAMLYLYGDMEDSS